MKLSLKDVRIHRDMSRETECFSATIYVDGGKAGTVCNKGHGGCHLYNWDDRELSDKVEDWAKTQPTKYDFEQLDQIIDDLLYREEVLKQLRNWTREKTAFRLKGDAKGSWRLVALPYSPKVEEDIRAKYGRKVEIVLHPSTLEAGLAY